MMHNDLFTRGPAREKRQLLFLFLTLSAVAAATLIFTSKQIFPFVMIGLASLSFIGFVFYGSIGRDIYIFFGLVVTVIGGVISWLIIRIVYLAGIVFFGLLMKPFRVDYLKKNFERGKKLTTNFTDAPATDAESFRRQS